MDSSKEPIVTRTSSHGRHDPRARDGCLETGYGRKTGEEGPAAENGGLYWAYGEADVGEYLRTGYNACLQLTYRIQLRKLRSQTTYAPYLRPAPPYIIDVRRTKYVSLYSLPIERCFPLLAITT